MCTISPNKKKHLTILHLLHLSIKINQLLSLCQGKYSVAGTVIKPLSGLYVQVIIQNPFRKSFPSKNVYVIKP